MRPPSIRVILPVLATVAVGLVFFRYSLLTGLDRVQADTGDSRFVTFILEHWYQVAQGKIDWRSPPIFWPVRGTLAYSDMLLGMGAVHAALRTVFPLFVALTVQLMLLTIGTVCSAFLLLRRGFELSRWGATVGACFVAFCWPRFAQLVHVQLQFTLLTPILFLLALEIGRDGPVLTRKAVLWRAVAFATGLALLLATVLYYAIFVGLALTVALLLCVLHAPARRHLAVVVRRHAGSLVGAALLFAALAAPILAFYGPVISSSGGRSWAEIVLALPTLTNFGWMGPENLAWGWLFARWPEATILLRRPELRIGVGLIASAGWLGAIGLAIGIVRRRPLDRRAGLVALTILTGVVLQLLMLRLPGNRSLWWIVWSAFPGATGIRAVARLQLVVTIAMAVGFGALIDRALARWPRRRLALAMIVVLAAIEQIGATQTYSAKLASDLSRMVADAIPSDCTAAYVVAPADMRADPPPVDEAHFDAAAYFAANPDVAAAWGGTAWEHYDRFGRAEHRTTDPNLALIRTATMFFAYNYTVPLAAQMRGIPVVNGLSGWEPPGWNLFDVLSPAAPERLEAWLLFNRVPSASVCTVPVRITLPMIADPPARLMP